MRPFQIISNQKNNVDCALRSTSIFLRYFYSVPKICYLQQANLEPMTTSLFPDFLLSGEV